MLLTFDWLPFAKRMTHFSMYNVLCKTTTLPYNDGYYKGWTDV